MRITVLLREWTELTLELLTVALRVECYRINDAEARLVAHEAGRLKKCVCGWFRLYEGLEWTMRLWPLGYGLVATKLGRLAQNVYNARPALALRLRE